jgi:hypothetical protein
MASRYIKGGDVVVTVTAAMVTAPAVNDTYTNNGVTWTVTAVSLVGTGLGGSGLGTITFIDRLCTSDGVLNTAASIVKATGAGSNVTAFTVGQPVATINIGEITGITTGDDIIMAATGGPITLVVDGTVAADMTRINTIPRLYSVGYGEILFQNSSTTTPMVVPLAAAYDAASGFKSSNPGTIKVRGDYIQIYTSDGTANQSFDLTIQDLNGRYIDRPACIEAEYDPVGAPGEYLPLINIGGASLITPYKNKGNVSTVQWMTFAEVGTSKDMGHVFEYDEYNGGVGYGKIYLGQDNCFTFGCISGATTNVVIGATYTHNGSTYTVVAVTNGTEASGSRTRILNCRRTTGAVDPTASGTLTLATGTGDATLTFNHVVVCGGFIPPNTAKIRIANIHITTDLASPIGTLPNFASSGAYAEGNYDIDTLSVSDRIAFNSANWNYFGTCTFRNFSCFNTSHYTSGANAGPQTWDGFFLAAYPYYSVGNGGTWTFGRALDDFSIDRFYTAIKSTGTSGIIIFQQLYSVVSIGELHVLAPRTVPGGTFAYYSLSFQYLKSAYSDRQSICGPWYLVGYKAYLSSAINIHIDGLYHSDSVTGVATTMFPCAVLETAGDSAYFTIKTVRLLTGGAPCYQLMLPMTPSGEFFSITDVDYDGRHPQTLANHVSSINQTGLPKRAHLTNAVIQGNRGVLTGGATLTPGPARLVNVYSTTGGIGGTSAENGLTIEHVSATAGILTPGQRRVDANPMHTIITGTSRTVGQISCSPNRPSTPETEFMEVLTGGASWGRNGATYYYMPEAGTARFKCPKPILGVTSMASATAAVTVTYGGSSTDFRMCNWGEDITALGWTALSTANIQAAFSALTGYDSNVGFNLEFRLGFAADSNNEQRSYSYIVIDNVTLDASFVATDIGYIHMNVYNVLDESVAAFIDVADNTFGYSTVGVSGSYTFEEFPYDCDGLAKYFKAVVRKPGYSEISIVGDVYALGVALPATGILLEATTNADVADIAATGATETVAITASKTLAQLYQDSQWWSCLEANMIYPIPVVSGGNGAYTSAYDVTVSTGAVLNGSGSLAMGSNILTTEFTGAVAYTYTGGTWSQLTTIPTFSGGVVAIGAADTFEFTGASVNITATPTSTTDYDLSACTFTGSNVFWNTSAHNIDVIIPAGASFVSTGSPGAGTVTFVSPAVERGIAFTGLQTGTSIQVFTSGTQTKLFGDNSTAGSTFAFDDATSGSITVDYTIQKAGYLPQRVTGLVLTGAVGGQLDVAVTQLVDRAYAASSGLTYGTTAVVTVGTNPTTNPGTKTFTLSAASTGQNWYSFWIEQWIDLGNATGEALANVEFPLSANGPNSFTLNDGWTFSNGATSIAFLSRDGLRYLNTSDVLQKSWAAILTSGVPSGARVRYQQSDAGTTVDAAVASGNMDELVQIYDTGVFDYRGYLVLKVQEAGYDQAEADVVATYGNLEDQLYVVGLTPTANGVATGDPALTITITQGTFVESSKTFSVKIVDNATPSSGTDILRELRYNFETGGTYQGEDAFNWHDLVRTNGSNFKTVRGTVYGTAATKGVVVYMNDGVTLHPDFDLFTADDGTTYAPPVYADISITGLPTAGGASRRVQIINTTALSAAAWAANTAYAAGDIVKRSTGIGSESTAGLYFRATTGGTSHVTTEPTWDITPGNTTSDGTVTWTCYKILFYDADPAAASLTDTYIDGEEFLAGETVTIRVAEMDAATTFKTYDTAVVTTASGFSALADMEADSVYAENALDGSAYEATFSPNFTLNYIVLDANTDFAGKAAYAYFCYTLTTSNGMYSFWGGVTALDSGNYRINSSILNLYFDESAGFVKQTDSVRIFRSDGTRPALDPTTGGSGIEINWRVPVNVVSTGGSALTAPESAHLLSLPTAADVWNHTLP